MAWSEINGCAFGAEYYQDFEGEDEISLIICLVLYMDSLSLRCSFMKKVGKAIFAISQTQDRDLGPGVRARDCLQIVLYSLL